jgi:hypothetical protein
VNFKSKEGSVVPIVSEFDLFHDYDGKEDEASSVPSNEMEDLRRSKRKTVHPERYVGFDVEKLEVGNFRTWPYKRSSYVIDDENSSSDSEEEDDVNNVEVDDRVSLGDYYSFGREKRKRIRFNGSDDIDFESKMEGIHLKKGAQTKRYNSIFTSRNHVHEEQDRKGGRSLNADARKEMIDTYMKNFDSLPTEEELTINEETSKLEEKEEENVSKSVDEEENHDDLWAEMETALISSNLLDGTEVCDNCLTLVFTYMNSF